MGCAASTVKPHDEAKAVTTPVVNPPASAPAPTPLEYYDKVESPNNLFTAIKKGMCYYWYPKVATRLLMHNMLCQVI